MRGAALRLRRFRLSRRSCLRLVSRRVGGEVVVESGEFCASLVVVGVLGGVGDGGIAGAAHASSVRGDFAGVDRPEGICAGSAHRVSSGFGGGEQGGSWWSAFAASTMSLQFISILACRTW